jgi:predicted dehydrogenase
MTASGAPLTGRLRAAVIGCGVGSNHAYAYQHHPDVDLVAICDVNPAIFDRVYASSGVERGAVRTYTDYQEMLRQERPDLVSVATPDHYHAGPVIEAAAMGVAGILCEKPIASSLADADRMIEAVERYGTKMLVDHTRNFDPAYVEVRNRVRQGEIGSLTRIVAYLGGKRAMLFRNATHLLGSICFFAESEPSWVFAALDEGFENYGLEYKGEGGKDPALDPGATLVINFANGVRALVMASKRTPAFGVQVDLLGTRGRIVVGDGATQAWQCEAEEGALVPRPVTWRQGIDDGLGKRLVPAVDHLIAMVRHDVPADSPPRAARDVLELIFGALRSQAEGMVPIHLPAPR